ncbi:phage tail sheath family protein [Rummeliibacillus stabekisii]|uniref:Phage tail protein n=1 Tax=Rummeliibacillus stabekisii TaxID=241244 RepID=A0A143HDI3_9BACL|nr:hypothetical protein [Rummeliibacillus stabekisii]AMW99311.1 hypothetical protein ATY39_07430 [Rummeliibacillus stabekisii]
MVKQYLHGVYSTETPSTEPPTVTKNGVQFVVGVAPIHLAKEPKVNEIVIAESIDDVKKFLGYSDDFAFGTSESAFASFEVAKVAPVVFVNVLDPEKHVTAEKTETVTITKNGAFLKSKRALLGTVTLKSIDDSKTFIEDTDYTIAYDANYQAIIYPIASSTNLATGVEVKVTFKEVDVEAVTVSDILGGYDASTSVTTGLELVRKVYPRYAVRPDILLAPGFSQNPIIKTALEAKTANISGVFKARTFTDIDTKTAKTYEQAQSWKEDNLYTDMRNTVLWPKVKKDGKILNYSSYLAAFRSAQIANDEDNLPVESFSNKEIGVDAFVLEDGTEVYLEHEEANALNGAGIVTGLQWGGVLRSWGNNTALYPKSVVAQDRFSMVRDALDWYANSFITEFFDKVDDLTNMRLIESITDEENARLSVLVGKGRVAGAEISFSTIKNSVAQILNGQIYFDRKVAFFTPAEVIQDEVTFDPTFIETAIFG